MELKFIPCPSQEALNCFEEIDKRMEGDYLEKPVLQRPSAVFVKFYQGDTWVGYALLESMKLINIGTLLDDISDEEDFERALEFIEKHMKEDGYYLHILKIFEVYQGNGFGTQAERMLTEKLEVPILLYTVADSETFWLRQGYESLNGEYYLYKGVQEEVLIG